MRKRILVVCLIGIMMMSLSSCGMGVLGKWRITEVVAGDVVMTEDDISGMGMDEGFIKINKSGSCDINLLGDEYQGTWEGKNTDKIAKNTSIKFEYGTDLSANASFDDKGIMTFVDATGAVYTLVK